MFSEFSSVMCISILPIIEKIFDASVSLLGVSAALVALVHTLSETLSTSSSGYFDKKSYKSALKKDLLRLSFVVAFFAGAVLFSLTGLLIKTEELAIMALACFLLAVFLLVVETIWIARRVRVWARA